MPIFELTLEEAQQLIQRVINSDPLIVKLLQQMQEQRPPQDKEKSNGDKP